MWARCVVFLTWIYGQYSSWNFYYLYHGVISGPGREALWYVPEDWFAECRCKWIYEIKMIYLNCGERYEVINDHRSYLLNLSSCEIKAWKKFRSELDSKPWRFWIHCPSYIHRVLSIMPKIQEISIGIQMEKFVSVSSDRNIQDHLWRWSAIGRNIATEIRRSIFDKPVGNSVKEFKMTRAISIGWPI